MAPSHISLNLPAEYVDAVLQGLLELPGKVGINPYLVIRSEAQKQLQPPPLPTADLPKIDTRDAG